MVDIDSLEVFLNPEKYAHCTLRPTGIYDFCAIVQNAPIRYIF